MFHLWSLHAWYILERVSEFVLIYIITSLLLLSLLVFFPFSPSRPLLSTGVILVVSSYYDSLDLPNDRLWFLLPNITTTNNFTWTSLQTIIRLMLTWCNISILLALLLILIFQNRRLWFLLTNIATITNPTWLSL